MEDRPTSVVEEDTKLSEEKILSAPLTSSSSQPNFTLNVCPSPVNSTRDRNASLPSTPTVHENKPMNSATNQTENSDGLVQITTIQPLDNISKPLSGMSKLGTSATSPHVSSTPVRLVTLKKVAAPAFNRQSSSPQITGLTIPPSRMSTPQSPRHALHLATNQNGIPCYTKVFQCSPGSFRIGQPQPQVTAPSSLPTTLTVIRGTDTTMLVNGAPATMTAQSKYVINTSPSKGTDTQNKHGEVKRPMNAFMVWARQYRQTLSRRMLYPSNTDVSVLLGRIWNNMSDEDKRPYYEEAKTIKMQHKITHPGWVYKPHKHRRTLDPVTTTLSSLNLTGYAITTSHSGSNSTQSTATQIYKQTTALHSPMIIGPGALAAKASPFKEPGKVSSTSSPQPYAASSPQLGSMLTSLVIRTNPVSISQSSSQLGVMPRSSVIRANPVSVSQMIPGTPEVSTMTKPAAIASKTISSSIAYQPKQHVQIIRGPIMQPTTNNQTASTGISAQGNITIRNSSGVCQTVPVRLGFRPYARPTLSPIIVSPSATAALPVRPSLTTINTQISPQLGVMPRSPVVRANAVSISQSSPQLGVMPRSSVFRANPVSVSQVIPGTPEVSTMTKPAAIASKTISSSIAYQPKQHVQIIRGPIMQPAANNQTASTGISAQGNITIRNSSGVCQTVPVRLGFRPYARPTLSPITVSPSATAALPVRPSLTTINTQMSSQFGVMPRSSVFRANPVSVSQVIPGTPEVSTMTKPAAIAPKTISSSIAYQPKQHVQIIRGPIMQPTTNNQTASTGISAQGNITIRNSSMVCQTVPVRIGFRPYARPTLSPIIVFPSATAALPVRPSLTTINTSEQVPRNHLQYNFMRTNNFASTITSCSSVGKPSAPGRPPSSSQRNMVTVARTIHPLPVRNELRGFVRKKKTPFLPVYSSTNTDVGTGTMTYQSHFVPITIPQVVPKRAPKKPYALAVEQKYGAVRKAVELQTSVQMSNWSAVAKGSVQQSPGQSITERTAFGPTQDLKNRAIVPTYPVQHSPGNLPCQTHLSTAAIPHQSSTFPLPKQVFQNVVYSNSTTVPGLSTNPTYSIRAPINAPPIISREHSYPSREYQPQAQGHFRVATENQVKYTPVSSIKQIEPEWWYLPFSPYPLNNLLQKAAHAADARPFINEDNGSSDDGSAEEDDDNVQCYGEATHWKDYCDPYNPAYFDSSNTQGAELCGNVPSLNMQRWSSYLKGSVPEDNGSILGEPMNVPTSHQSIDNAAQRSVIGDQKTFIDDHKALLKDPVRIQQDPMPDHSQSQLDPMPGQCQIIPESGPVTSFVRAGKTYHVLQQQCSAPSVPAAQILPQSAATAAGDHLIPAKPCLPPKKRPRQF